MQKINPISTIKYKHVFYYEIKMDFLPMYLLSFRVVINYLFINQKICQLVLTCMLFRKFLNFKMSLDIISSKESKIAKYRVWATLVSVAKVASAVQ